MNIGPMKNVCHNEPSIHRRGNPHGSRCYLGQNTDEILLDKLPHIKSHRTSIMLRKGNSNQRKNKSYMMCNFILRELCKIGKNMKQRQ